jgi:NHL repeat
MSGGALGQSRKAGVCFTAMLLALGIATAPAHAEFGFITSWPLTGTDPSASGVATDPAGNVYVASRNSEIQQFTADGELITKWGSGGPGPGQFATNFGASILDVAIGSGGDVYVADLWGNRVHRFTADGTFLGRWGSLGTGNGEFIEPSGIATDPAGDVYVGDPGNDRIQKFDRNGDFITQWSTGQFSSPIDVATDSGGNVYVADLLANDAGNHIQRFTSDGALVSQWGTAGQAPGQFVTPTQLSVATDAAGDVYVTEQHLPGGLRDTLQFTRLQKFSSNGAFISEFGCHGSGVENFVALEGVATDAAGNVYVGDGSTIHKLGDPGTPADCSLALDARAKHRQKLKKRHVFASCPEEACELTIDGRVEAGRRGDLKNARLRSKHRSLGAGEEQKIPLQFEDRRDRRRIHRALQGGGPKKARMLVHLEAEDAHGIGAAEDVSFRLKR